MFLNSAKFIEIRNGCHQRGHSRLEKHKTFEFSHVINFYAFLKNRYIFEIFGKINNVPLKHVNPCTTHFLRYGNEIYTSKDLYYTIFEDKHVTTAAHFRFQCQILTTKITKSVDDF